MRLNSACHDFEVTQFEMLWMMPKPPIRPLIRVEPAGLLNYKPIRSSESNPICESIALWLLSTQNSRLSALNSETVSLT